MTSKTLVLALSLLAPTVTFAASPDPARARTEQLISTFKKVKPELPAPEKKALYDELDATTDFDTIASSALAPRAEKFTAKQKADFQAKFQELIRLVAYPAAGDFFRKAKLSFKPAVSAEESGKATFRALRAGSDLDTEVTLHWSRSKASNGALKIVDVSFDGDSLVQDYKNQFARIVDREGVPALFKKLEERREALLKGKKAP